jgi:hypothetical protein
MSLIKYKILLIDNKIKGIDIISNSINNNIKIIILNEDIKTYVSLISYIDNLKLSEIDQIGLIKHEEYNETINILTNSWKKHRLKEVSIKDPNLYSWIELTKCLK